MGRVHALAGRPRDGSTTASIMCTTPPQEKGPEKEVRVRGDHQEASPDEESFEDMMRELYHNQEGERL